MAEPIAPFARTPAGDALRRNALRRNATPNAGGSPLALEASLAEISAEVTAEAVERLAQHRK
jgi:hypothetical protein